MKYLILLIMVFFFINVVSAVSCTQPGYAYCWENSYTYGTATARAKIYWQFEDDNGLVTPNDNAIGNLYVKSGYSGTTSTNGYAIYNAPSWDNIWNRVSCDSIGNCKISINDYSFTPSASGGRVKIASIGDTFTKCLVLLAIDTNKNPDYWAWTGAGYGWVGSGNCVSIKVVSAAECQTGQEKCEGTSYYLCENNKWANKGQVIGKCGIDCLSASDCGQSNYVGSRLCSGNNVVQKWREYSCSFNKCSYQDADKTLEYCQYGCENGVCKVITCTEGEKKCVGNDLMVCRNNQFSLQETCDYGCENNSCKPGPTNIWGILLLIIIVIAIFGGLIFVLIRLRRR